MTLRHCRNPWACSIAATLLTTLAAASPGPTLAPFTTSVPAPVDRAYPGTLRVDVDATDILRRIVRVHETVPVTGSTVTLMYPEWLPGTHAPEGPIDRLAGLLMTANGTRVEWQRDPLNMYAFHVTLPKGAASLEIDFQYLSPVSEDVGGIDLSSDILLLEWTATMLYPAGYYTRQIPVEASIALPAGWQYATALETAGSSADRVRFKRTTVETFGDSPLYAGRLHRTIDLAPGEPTAVRLQVFADRSEDLEATAEQIGFHRALVQQAARLFGAHHYDHYDFLFSLSDRVHYTGTEHHQSSEDGLPGNYFSDWAKGMAGRSLLGHEYTHSWNGKFRRPYDLWTPTYDVPMRNSLLWVYEGQTQYWGEVLTARAGLWTRAEALEALADTAAYYDHFPGRSWRTLSDTTNDEIINPRRPMSWSNWQRFEDYYSEGQLIWLDADTLIRERSKGARSLDDFARRFFGINDGSYVPVTYRFEDVVAALNAVEPYDWATFLTARLTGHGPGAPLDGIGRGGYRLAYDDTANAYISARETENKHTNLLYSLGFAVDHEGKITELLWDSPAFAAGLTSGITLLAVNGANFDGEALKAAVRAARTGKEPVRLLIKQNKRLREVAIDYHDGLRYPHLVRDETRPALLDAILAPKG